MIELMPWELARRNVVRIEVLRAVEGEGRTLAWFTEMDEDRTATMVDLGLIAGTERYPKAPQPFRLRAAGRELLTAIYSEIGTQWGIDWKRCREIRFPDDHL